MDLSLTEEQQLLQDSARDFLRQECPTTHVRAEEDLTGYSRAVAEDDRVGLGWLDVSRAVRFRLYVRGAVCYWKNSGGPCCPVRSIRPC